MSLIIFILSCAAVISWYTEISDLTLTARSTCSIPSCSCCHNWLWLVWYNICWFPLLWLSMSCLLFFWQGLTRNFAHGWNCCVTRNICSLYTISIFVALTFLFPYGYVSNSWEWGTKKEMTCIITYQALFLLDVTWTLYTKTLFLKAWHPDIAYSTLYLVRDKDFMFLFHVLQNHQKTCLSWRHHHTVVWEIYSRQCQDLIQAYLRALVVYTRQA